MNIVIAHFNTNWVNFSGGVEKVTCQLANALCKRGHQVTILYRDGKEGPPYFPLDSSVKTDNILFENGKTSSSLSYWTWNCQSFQSKGSARYQCAAQGKAVRSSYT